MDRWKILAQGLLCGMAYLAGRLHGLRNERIEIQKVFDAWAESDKALFTKFTSFFLSTHKRD